MIQTRSGRSVVTPAKFTQSTKSTSDDTNSVTEILGTVEKTEEMSDEIETVVVGEHDLVAEDQGFLMDQVVELTDLLNAPVTKNEEGIGVGDILDRTSSQTSHFPQ